MSFLTSRRKVSKKLTTKSYVQGGLVAMWDGIENIGVGRHSDNAKEWVDLTGNGRNWQLINTARFNSNSLLLEGEAGAEYLNTIPLNSHITQEIVFKVDSDSRDSTTDRTVIAIFGNTESLGGYNLNLAGIAYNRTSANTYGWLSKSYFITKTNSNIVPKTQFCHTIIYDSNNTLQTSPKQMYINNFAQTISNSSEGWANTAQRNRVGSNFYGKIYAIRIYNRELTSDEISRNFELDKERFGLNL